jgi:hypothetical protein
MATGTYDMIPELDVLATSNPADQVTTVGIGQNVFSATYTVTGALGVVSGSVTVSGRPISTGVLIVVTTVTFAGSPPVPPALSTATLAGNPYYIGSSHEDGGYSIEVRQSTSPTYRVYAYYPVVNSTGAVTINSQTLTNVSVLAGQTVGGKNIAW